MTLGNVNREPEAGKTRDAMDEANVGKGTAADLQRGRQPRFEGCEPRLQGHIYDWTGERTPERYIRTTREISTYVGVMYTKYMADFTSAVDTLDLANPDEPPAPDPANQVAFE